MSQANISSYFTPSPKRKAKVARPRPDSPIDLTQDDEAPQTKKRKTTSTFFSSPGASSSRVVDSSPSVRASTVLQQYRRDSSSVADSPRNAAKDAIRHKRREKLKRLLLTDNNVFTQGSEGDEPEDDDAEALDGSQEVPEEDVPDGSDDKRFEDLMKAFGNPQTKSKGSQSKKTSATGKKAGRKAKEIGPSGEAYTPMELQVWIICSLLVDANRHVNRYAT